MIRSLHAAGGFREETDWWKWKSLTEHMVDFNIHVLSTERFFSFMVVTMQTD